MEDLRKIIKEEQKRNPNYFKGSVKDNGESFEIVLSPFYRDLFKTILKENNKWKNNFKSRSHLMKKTSTSLNLRNILFLNWESLIALFIWKTLFVRIWKVPEVAKVI